jgi:hypothetical protein
MSIPEFQGTVPRVTQTQPDFDQNTQALLDWLVDEFVPGVNETAKAMNLNSTTGTSSTSNAIGTGAKTFTAETGKSWQPGMFIVIADAAAPSTNSMTAQVTSYNGGTGSLVVDVKSTLGSGTKSSWVISQTMNPVPLNGSVTNASVDKSIITGQSDETSPQPDDELLLSDKSESSGALNKIALANLLKVLNALTEDTNPDLNADYLLSYDASAAAVKKVLMGRSNMYVGTAQVTTSGTSIEVTGVPSWINNILIPLAGVSTNGTDAYLLQIGDAGGYETTGYTATSINAVGSGSTASLSSTAGFIIRSADAGNTASGHILLTRVSGNTWISSHNVKLATTYGATGGGDKTLSDALDRFRLTTTGGANTFDAGALNWMGW